MTDLLRISDSLRSVMAGRPPRPSYGPEPGYVWAVAPDDGWRVVNDPGTSRMMGCRGSLGPGKGYCHRNSAACMNRGRHVDGPPWRVDSWWFYCAEHMYGRWVESGQVVHWVRREAQS